ASFAPKASSRFPSAGDRAPANGHGHALTESAGKTVARLATVLPIPCANPAPVDEIQMAVSLLSHSTMSSVDETVAMEGIRRFLKLHATCGHAAVDAPPLPGS